MLARAVAGEANVPFFTVSASEFVEMIVGVGASRVRDLFKQARKAAPAIIFIDELDAVGRSRGAGPSLSGRSEQEQTLNQILTEMDGFSPGEGVIVIAATNRPDVLDPALLRPGRFDRQVTVQAPDRAGRDAILAVHTQRVPLASDVDLPALASATPGLVGADLRNLVNEAALFAARHGHDAVRHKDFMDALEKVLMGPARQVFISPIDRQRVAYHEGGHTIVGLVLPDADPVTRVTIMPRGSALGLTYQQPQDDRYMYDEPYVRARITGALGGRAAEEVVFGVRTSGASNDMIVATDLARQMVTRWGMSEQFGALALAPRGGGFLGYADSFAGGTKPFSEATAQRIDDEVQRILDECYALAIELLNEHRGELEALADALLERESLDESEIIAATGLTPAGRATARAC
jgi:cell division protease FtsH